MVNRKNNPKMFGNKATAQRNVKLYGNRFDFDRICLYANEAMNINHYSYQEFYARSANNRFYFTVGVSIGSDMFFSTHLVSNN